MVRKQIKRKQSNMKKLIISVGALGVMSFTGNNIYNSYKLAEAIDNIQDMKEWMSEDVYNGKISDETATDYFYIFEETEKDLIEYMEENRLIGDF